MQPRRAPLALLFFLVVALLVPAGCKKDSPTAPKTGPTANFVAAPVTGNSPMDVDFTNQSASGSAPITSVLWSFGDGTNSTQNNPFHTYGTAGTYTVSLTVTTADGSDTRVRDDYIVVGSGPGTTPPNALFTAAPTAGSAPLNVQFTDQSTQGSSPITSWAWTFGDGGTSTSQSPAHTYTANGSYTVALSVTTSVGTDTGTRADYIVVSPAPVAPTAQFSGTPTDGNAPLTVQFTDQSTPGSGSITSRSWTFGDGGTSAVTSPSHTYNAAGTYTVSLTVTGTSGSDSDTKTGFVTVRPSPVAPVAQFSGTPRTGAAPLAVQFTDQSAPGTSPITAWSWTFGDGGTSILANPGHTYNAAGSYTVGLTVTTADGQNTNTKTGYVTPCAAPLADFLGAPTTGLAPLAVLFTDVSTGAATSRSWSFGDGGTSTAATVTHTYANPGTYNVSLTVTNACGSNTSTKNGYITAQDACPNPEYSVTTAAWSNNTAGPDPGYRTRARLTWNTQVSAGCSRSVFARIYTKPVADSTWTLYNTTSCYTVSGGKANNFSMFIQGLAKNCYDLRIAVYECGTTVEKASREPADDPDLVNECFEP